jgi:hypothetical protein
MDRLKAVLQVLDNDKSKLVIDLSCRRKDDKWFVATNKWQTITDFELNQGTFRVRISQPSFGVNMLQTPYPSLNPIAPSFSSTLQMLRACSAALTMNSLPNSPNGAASPSHTPVGADQLKI